MMSCKLNPLLVALMLLFVNSCGKNYYKEFFVESFAAKVDSIRTPGMSLRRVYLVQVDGRWYKLPFHYTPFVEYVSKGDSVFKDSNRWDIRVKKKIGNETVEKYFEGAQDDWGD